MRKRDGQYRPYPAAWWTDAPNVRRPGHRSSDSLLIGRATRTAAESDVWHLAAGMAIAYAWIMYFAACPAYCRRWSMLTVPLLVMPRLKRPLSVNGTRVFRGIQQMLRSMLDRDR
jgi:hypothetical protein